MAIHKEPRSEIKLQWCFLLKKSFLWKQMKQNNGILKYANSE